MGKEILFSYVVKLTFLPQGHRRVLSKLEHSNIKGILTFTPQHENVHLMKLTKG